MLARPRVQETPSGLQAMQSHRVASCNALKAHILSCVGFNAASSAHLNSWVQQGSGTASTQHLASLVFNITTAQQISTFPPVSANSVQSSSSFNQTAGQLSTSEPHQPQHQRTDWTQHRVTQFSVRPSYLSPLYACFQQEHERHERCQLVLKLLEAHKILADDHDGFDESQIERTVQHRVSEIRQLAKALRELKPSSNLATCAHRQDLMVGFYELLEQQATSSAADSEAFHKVVQGLQSPWEHWVQQFALRYHGTPSLEPLATLYAKGTQRSRQRSEDLPPQLQPGQRASKRPVFGTLALDGTAVSDGRRKTSTAKVVLRKGHGRITINGLPVDEYFKDINLRAHVLRPFFRADALCRFNLTAEVEGGGLSGQAQAVAHGAARALQLQQPHAPLSGLTRQDDRRVERKKYGRKKARKGFTWVKR